MALQPYNWPIGVLVVGGLGSSKPVLPINLSLSYSLADSHNRGWTQPRPVARRRVSCYLITQLS